MQLECNCCFTPVSTADRYLQVTQAVNTCGIHKTVLAVRHGPHISVRREKGLPPALIVCLGGTQVLVSR